MRLRIIEFCNTFVHQIFKFEPCCSWRQRVTALKPSLHVVADRDLEARVRPQAVLPLHVGSTRGGENQSWSSLLVPRSKPLLLAPTRDPLQEAGSHPAAVGRRHALLQPAAPSALSAGSRTRRQAPSSSKAGQRPEPSGARRVWRPPTVPDAAGSASARARSPPAQRGSALFHRAASGTIAAGLSAVDAFHGASEVNPRRLVRALTLPAHLVLVPGAVSVAQPNAISIR